MSEIKTSWKDNYIAKFGEKAYNERLAHRKEWGQNLPGGEAQRSRERREEDPTIVWQSSRKEGKYYARKQEYDRTGLQGERNKIRHAHGKRWSRYKRIIAPDSVIHHSWIPETANYSGVALVEKSAHEHGIINIIQILKGEITLLTEKEIREQETKNVRG
jgi:hypothetical protein